MQQEIISRFQMRQARIAVIGLGYVGLPLAASFAQAGYDVIGIDLDRRKVEAINSGESYIEDVPAAVVQALVQGQAQLTLAGAEQREAAHSSSLHPVILASSDQSRRHQSPGSRLRATTDFSVLATCDAVSICVPTPLSKTGDPDMSYIVTAAEQIARYLHPGMVVVLESTTYPGTTTEVVLPILMGEDRETRRQGD